MSKVRVLCVFLVLLATFCFSTTLVSAIDLHQVDLGDDFSKANVIEEEVTKPVDRDFKLNEDTRPVSTPDPKHPPLPTLKSLEPSFVQRVVLNTRDYFVNGVQGIKDNAPNHINKIFSFVMNDFTRNSVRISIFPPYNIYLVLTSQWGMPPTEELPPSVDFPKDLPTLPENDGTKGYAIRPPIIRDYVTRDFFYLGSAAFEVFGFTDAARNMRHFLDNTGSTLYVSPESMLQDMPAFRNDLNVSYENILLPRLKKHIDTGKYVKSDADLLTTGWIKFTSTSYNWNKAIGDYRYRIETKIKVYDEDGSRKIEVERALCVWDMYNWDQQMGKGVRLVWIPIKDAVLSKLHEAGIAKEYEIRGVYNLGNVVYEYEDLGGDYVDDLYKVKEKLDKRLDVDRQLN